MPNVKFSGFSPITSVGANGFLVGYDSVTNLNTRITLANLKTSLGVMNPTSGYVPYNNGGTFEDSALYFTSAGFGQAQSLSTYLPIGVFQNGLYLYNDPAIASSAVYRFGHFDTSLSTDTYIRVVEGVIDTYYNAIKAGIELSFPSDIYKFGKFSNLASDQCYLEVRSTIGTNEITSNYNGGVKGFDLNFLGNAFEFGDPATYSFYADSAQFEGRYAGSPYGFQISAAAHIFGTGSTGGKLFLDNTSLNEKIIFQDSGGSTSGFEHEIPAGRTYLGKVGSLGTYLDVDAGGGQMTLYADSPINLNDNGTNTMITTNSGTGTTDHLAINVNGTAYLISLRLA